jgi:hypothetical protein
MKRLHRLEGRWRWIGQPSMKQRIGSEKVTEVVVHLRHRPTCQADQHGDSERGQRWDRYGNQLRRDRRAFQDLEVPTAEPYAARSTGS